MNIFFTLYYFITRNCKRLKLSDFTVYEHRKRLGFVSKLGFWVLHLHTEENLICRISIYNMLFKRQEYDPFLKRFITENIKY